MERIPIALSLPHCGTRIPEEVAALCQLSEEDIAASSEPGLAELCGPLMHAVEVFATTKIARIFVDLDRGPEDRGPDGVVKQRTRSAAQVFHSFPSERVIEGLLARYYRPFHDQLGQRAYRAILGMDWHATLPQRAARGRSPRTPAMRIHANSDVPCSWTRALATTFAELLPTEPTIVWRNAPGYITRTAPGGIPWLRVELTQGKGGSPGLTHEQLRQALDEFCRRIQRRRRTG